VRTKDSNTNINSIYQSINTRTSQYQIVTEMKKKTVLVKPNLHRMDLRSGITTRLRCKGDTITTIVGSPTGASDQRRHPFRVDLKERWAKKSERLSCTTIEMEREYWRIYINLEVIWRCWHKGKLEREKGCISSVHLFQCQSSGYPRDKKKRDGKGCVVGSEEEVINISPILWN
jgi:hypothetical protein